LRGIDPSESIKSQKLQRPASNPACMTPHESRPPRNHRRHPTVSTREPSTRLSALRLRDLMTRVTRKLATMTGYELTRRDGAALSRLAGAGVSPCTTIDVGAAFGDWTRSCAAVFPEAQYVLVEPLQEFRPALDATADAVTGIVIPAAAASAPGQGTLNVHRDLVGSSLLREREGPEVDGNPRQIDVVSIDSLVAERSLEAPFLIKIDVQGAELEVLAGAHETLVSTVALIVEVSFFSFYVDGTAFEALVAALRQAGFVVFDIQNLNRRPLDGALAQADVIFVPEDSPARREHVYASVAQRAAQDREFEATVKRRLRAAQR
jgi:FkbM family methyltransferase